MIYNFRFDRNQREEILKRIKTESLLCQGWGGGKDGNLNIETEGKSPWEYRKKVSEYYDLPSTRIPANLLRIRDFRDGDLLVVPHLPEYGKVSVFTVDSDFPDCCNYHNSDPCHLNHQIKVKKYYGLEGNIHIHNARLTPWYGKLQWMRLPILPMEQHENIFVEICSEIDRSPSTRYTASKIDEYFRDVSDKILKVIHEKLESISPSSSEISFEKVCEYLIGQQGYSIEDRNSYNREGGDIDLHCVRKRSDISPFEIGEDTLFVQVKKHEGTTDSHAVHQLLKMMKANPEANGCVMSLAEEYTKEARKLADKNGILLLSQKSILSLLFKALGEKLTLDES